MVKRLVAFTLLLTFGIQTFSKAFIVIDYYTNVSAFAKSCENKAKPKMHCNGKCQMMKKLKQEEKNDRQNPERKAENKNEITLSSKSFFDTTISLKYRVALLTYTDLNPAKTIKMSGSVFHPPSAWCSPLSS